MQLGDDDITTLIDMGLIIVFIANWYHMHMPLTDVNYIHRLQFLMSCIHTDAACKIVVMCTYTDGQLYNVAASREYT